MTLHIRRLRVLRFTSGLIEIYNLLVFSYPDSGQSQQFTEGYRICYYHYYIILINNFALPRSVASASKFSASRIHQFARSQSDYPARLCRSDINLWHDELIRFAKFSLPKIIEASRFRRSETKQKICVSTCKVNRGKKGKNTQESLNLFGPGPRHMKAYLNRAHENAPLRHLVMLVD